MKKLIVLLWVTGFALAQSTRCGKPPLLPVTEELVGVLWQFRFQFSFCHNFCGNFVFKNQFATLLPDFFRPGETSEMFKLSISTDCLVRHYLLSLQLFNNDQNKTESDQ
jgi:hypothetical protein